MYACCNLRSSPPDAVRRGCRPILAYNHRAAPLPDIVYARVDNHEAGLPRPHTERAAVAADDAKEVTAADGFGNRGTEAAN
jgi:hypothetical protein